MTTADPIAVVHDLTKRYGSFTALHGVSFEIARGEVLSLLGPNGAGKSTTLEIMEGYRDRTTGRVQVLGEDPGTAGRAWRARLGIVGQSTGAAESATVRELVGHFATFYPRPRDAAATIEAVGLADKARARIASLSGGQRRRLDVALGIIGRPELLFLDEPTTGFDPEARRRFWELIEQLRDEGTTILLTTHYLDEAAHLSDRAVVIAAGRVVAEGPIDRLGGEEARTPIVRWSEGPTVRSVRTDEPARMVAGLHRTEGEPTGLEVIRPSLEDIYLGIIARAEDAQAEDGTATDDHHADGRSADADHARPVRIPA